MNPNAKFYKLPTQTIPGLKLSDFLSDIIEIRKFFESRGINTANTRLERYAQYFLESSETGSANESLIFKNSLDARFRSRIDWMMYVLREVHELMWILRGLKQHIPAGLDKKLHEIISGSDFAAFDKNSHSRNVQFELRIASYFCQSGCEVDLTTDTDVVATSQEFGFYIECKRVASAKHLVGRLEKAAKQLSKRMPNEYKTRPTIGIVAADVTAVAYPHNGLTWAITEEHSRDIIRGKLDEVAAKLRLPPICFNQNILDYWFQIHIPSIIRQPPTPTTRFSSLFSANRQFDIKAIQARKILRRIFEVCHKKDERETPSRTLKERQGLHLPSGTKVKIVNPVILQEFRTNGKFDTKQTDAIAELVFDGTKHEFFMDDLAMILASIPEDESKRLTQSNIETDVELVIRMYMHRFPYEDNETNSQEQ